MEKVHESFEKRITTDKPMELSPGLRLSLEGELYTVEKVNKVFISIKYTSICPEENRPKEHRRKLKKNDSFSVGGQRYLVISALGNTYYKIRKTAKK